MSMNSFPSWVPKEILSGYAEKGIHGLFDWQTEVVKSCNDSNYVFCAPTSAGKGLVADLFALKVALTGKRVLIVLPYIAVAKEKLSFLQKLWRRVDIQVAGYIGVLSTPNREWTAAVCTIEKANSLINHAILDGTISDYGMIVLDELHMILDSSRGPTLEALITKIIYHNSTTDTLSRIQIIGMSATLPDLQRFEKWLPAKVYETDFRPIELHHCYSVDGILYEVGSRRVIRRLDKRFRYPGDLDCTVGFCVETVLDKKSTLVFCSSKSEVEKIALEVAKVMDAELKKREIHEKLISEEALMELKALLERSCRQLDPVLAKCLPRGVAYHHAGLTTEERECVEKAFREGTVHALIATSTLSSGVNLPASRVIIKAQTRGPAALNSTSYGQMAGRAGRMGFSERGESIVAIKPNEVETVLRLMTTLSPTVNATSRDASKVILEGVCSGLASSVSSVRDLSSHLLYTPSISPEQTLIELSTQSLISSPDEEESKDEVHHLSATQLGRAALASSLPPDAALFVFTDLKNAAKALAVDTELHMMYLVTPINCSVWQGSDWNHLHSLFCKLHSNQKRIAKMVGVNERFILARLQGKYIRPNDREYQLHLRFFSALALFDVITEVPLVDVAAKFRICRGSLQALQQQSATYAVMVVAFCNRLGWQYLRALLEGFAARLSFGIRAELTELVRVDGIDGSRARIFHDHGITSLAQLAQSGVQEVSTILSLAVPFQRNEGVHDGRSVWLVGEERMLLEEAANTVIARAGEAVQDRMKELGIIVHFDNVMTGQREQKPNSQSKSQRLLEDADIPVTKSGLANARSLDDEKENLPPSISSDVEERCTSTPLSKPCSKSRSSLSNSMLNCTQDSSLDIFSNSLLELSLEDPDTCDHYSCLPEEETKDTEVDDLETSLLKLNSSAIEDSFDRTVEFVAKTQKPKPRRLTLDDSFDMPLSQVLMRRSLGAAAKPRKSLQKSILEDTDEENSVVNTSGDLFESSSPVHAALKRNHQPTGCWSPSVSSPLGKSSRSTAPSSFKTLPTDDVCRSRAAWDGFVMRSFQWSSVSMAIVCNASKDSVVAVAFCTESGNPNFVPLTEECFPGSPMEEAVCPSSTQCQSISFQSRIDQIRLILEKCDVFCYDTLRLSSLLRDTSGILMRNGFCVALLAFLAHQRAGDSPTPLHQLACRFEWPFNLHSLLKMNPRVKICAEAYVISRIHDRLRSQAVVHSSQEAVLLEIRAIQVVSSISNGGFPFSRAKCASTLSAMRKEMSSLEDSCHQLAGRQFNLESAMAVSEILFKTMKLPHPGGQNAAGKRHLSASKAVLEQMVNSHPIISKILLFRKLKHAVSQCLLPLELHSSADDLIRTSFEVYTATGRLLSYRPNVQNLPKAELISGFSVRSLFVARNGRLLVAADYCQLELRVLAHLSGDPSLIKRLSDDGRDLFSELSSEWGFPRDAVKQLCYGIIYGMGVKSLADSTKSTVEQADRLLISFFRSFPKVKSYISKTKEVAESVGFVSTFLGRRRLACTRGRQEERSRDHRQSVNFTIQGTASEIFKKALIKIQDSFKDTDARIVMIVHDEVIVECLEEEVNEIMNKLRNEMENVFPQFKVPLKVKVTKGRDWSVLK